MYTVEMRSVDAAACKLNDFDTIICVGVNVIGVEETKICLRWPFVIYNRKIKE